jgi:hypothetical protein
LPFNNPSNTGIAHCQPAQHRNEGVGEGSRE